ncbi:DUF1566 domain-containing protein [Parasediminibacterium sp. JCM 36343]|uniref:Lcl domain-containing protein n=1 Tax=Parasediminibacterium sp. JCM 36343 TaxID=3374279 RepID=UPI00397B124C
MKKYFLLFISLVGIASFISCTKSNDSNSGGNNSGGGINKPSLETSAASNILINSAQSGGNITSDGGAAITARGVCYDTSPNPTTSFSLKTNDGIGTGIFPSIITGLLPNTTYYVRAYAKNSNGLSYGTQISFTTKNAPITPNINIGDTAYGGIIIELDYAKQHGIVVAPSDQSRSTAWNPNSGSDASYHPTITGAIFAGEGSGGTNTDKIIAVLGNGNNAASICRNYRGGGFSDWYLPSINELELIYLNNNVVGGIQGATIYWSSTESTQNGTTFAWGQNLNDGMQYQDVYEYSKYCVRAVRKF